MGLFSGFYTTHLDFTFGRKKSVTKYIGKKGNNEISKYLTKNIKVNYETTVTNIKFNSNFWTITVNNKKKVSFKYLILTCPFLQTKILASKYLKKQFLGLKVNMSPTITTMVAYKNYKKFPISSIKFSDQILAWAAHENSKNRFKSNQSLWTIQCTEAFSKKIINLYKINKYKFMLIILKRFQALLGLQIKNIVFKNMHGWKYSYNKTKTPFESIWDNKTKIGVCGDWLIGPKAEDAWSSARDLFNKIKKKPS
jgi:renalase